MRTKVCPYCREIFYDLDFPAQFERMVSSGKVGCMRIRRWERLGLSDKLGKKVDEDNYY